jgi:malonyl-CoA decarboxylase
MRPTSSFMRWVLDSIADRGLSVLGGLTRGPIESLCQVLVSERGEASGTAIAREIATRYREATPAQRLRFFDYLLGEQWLADPKEVFKLAKSYFERPTATALARLFPVAEPKRQELFRRINMGPGGTETIVSMRKDLLALLPEHPRFEAINADLVHLLSSWFNRGFLELRRIDWKTPALILEKLIAYEAVHEIRGWPDLRRRLQQDRRCFAFFHPALPDEPLIFVEVALTRGMARSIQPLIDIDSRPADPEKADTAVFYSISNCLEGLRGISFGAFLLKQVIHELEEEDLHLRNFVTLSPIPGFRKWLAANRGMLPPGVSFEAIVQAAQGESAAASDHIPDLMLRCCARYLTEARPDGRALDPVASFHLSNGASIERINWKADVSEKGIAQSFGLMVNYAYRPSRIERNHEQYVKQGRFARSEQVQGLLEEKKTA